MDSSEQWLHRLTYHQQRGRDGGGAVLQDVSPARSAWSTQWTLPSLKINNRLSYQHAVEEAAEGEQARDSVVIWDISIDYTISATQDVRLVISNLTDQNFYGSLDEKAALMPERTVNIEVRWIL